MLLEQNPRLGAMVVTALRPAMDVSTAEQCLRELHQCAQTEAGIVDVCAIDEDCGGSKDMLLENLRDLELLHEFLSRISWTPLLILSSAVVVSRELSLSIVDVRSIRYIKLATLKG